MTGKKEINLNENTKLNGISYFTYDIQTVCVYFLGTRKDS